MRLRAIVRRRFIPPDSGSTWSFGALGQLDEVEQLVGASGAFLRGEPEVAAVDDEVLADGQLRVEAVLLGHDAEARADLAGRAWRGSRPRTRSVPAVTGETQPIIRIVDRLAGAVRPEEAERLARRRRRSRWRRPR